MTRTWGRWLAAAVLCVAAAGCKEGGGGGIVEPTPGQLTVSLAATGETPRAVLLEVTGPGMTDPQPADPGYVLHSRAAGGVLRVAVFGELRGGPLLRFGVPDVGQPQLYAVRLVDAADAQNRLLPADAGVQLTVAR
ncbi:MAG TPA: hypothetical protein VFX98_14640 [Longimicrobiaceae bacterium]|nr:hypothetical protein [Longimicrobiaceae bacterium]